MNLNSVRKNVYLVRSTYQKYYNYIMTLNFASDKKIIFAIQVGRSNVCDSNNNELILNGGGQGDPGIPMSELH